MAFFSSCYGRLASRRLTSRRLLIHPTTALMFGAAAALHMIHALQPMGFPASSSSSIEMTNADLLGNFPNAMNGHRGSRLNVHTDREADFVEMLVGGERYSMLPLPDSMVATTLYVGNLCEFVDDEDLSQLFQSVSVLQNVPACVIRKADMTSLHYGFVSFPTEEEKEVRALSQSSTPFHRTSATSSSSGCLASCARHLQFACCPHSFATLLHCTESDHQIRRPRVER